MRKKRIVITGIGIVSPIGVGKEPFFDNLLSGVSNFKQVTSIDTTGFKVKTAGEVTGFDASVFLGKKGLSDLDRSSKFLLSAARMAIDDRKLVLKGTNRNTGVSVGTAMGVLNNTYRLHQERVRFGPKLVNPLIIQNATWNQAASRLAIKYDIMGVNNTLNTGICSGLDALAYAVDCINNGHADIMLAGAVEEISFPVLYGLNRIGCLSGSIGKEKTICCPFDKRRNGIIFSEGSVVFIVEKLSSAVKRATRIYAEIAACESNFFPYKLFKHDPAGRAIKTSMLKSIRSSGIKPGDMDYICCNANSTVEADRIESASIREVFGEHMPRIPSSAIKSVLGESLGVSGLFGVVASIASMERGSIPPTANLKNVDVGCELMHVKGKGMKHKVETAMVNAMDPNGPASSVVIKRFRG